MLAERDWSQCFSITRWKKAELWVKIFGKDKTLKKKPPTPHRITAKEHQEIWEDLITENKRMLRHDSLHPVLLQTSLAAPLCATDEQEVWKSHILPFMEIIFFPLCNISKPSSLFKKTHTQNKQKAKTTHHHTELSISPLHLYNHFFSSNFFFFLPCSSNTNIYLHAFKWWWIFWLTGFLFLFYNEKT